MVSAWIYFNLPLHSPSLPQQLPGPAQSACVGEEPQQEVSPGPGNFEAFKPDMEEWAEIIFSSLSLPQPLHRGLSPDATTRISLSVPQSRHRYS